MSFAKFEKFVFFSSKISFWIYFISSICLLRISVFIYLLCIYYHFYCCLNCFFPIWNILFYFVPNVFVCNYFLEHLNSCFFKILTFLLPQCCYPLIVLFVKKVYVFLERGEGREEERERNIDVWEKHWLVDSCKHLNQRLACNPGMSPD